MVTTSRLRSTRFNILHVIISSFVGRSRIDTTPILTMPILGPAPTGKGQAMLVLEHVPFYLFNDCFCFPPQLGGLRVEPFIDSIQDLLCNTGHLCQAFVFQKRLECNRRTKRSPLLGDTNLVLLWPGMGRRESGRKETGRSHVNRCCHKSHLGPGDQPPGSRMRGRRPTTELHSRSKSHFLDDVRNSIEC